jgi:hypothetical protein
LLKDALLSRYDGQSLQARTVSVAPGEWHITVRVPVGHWFLMVSSQHCGSLLATTSITGESRSFATGLYYGDVGPLDLRTNYIAGTLPFNGVTDIFVSPDGSPRNAIHPVVVGRYFYFDAIEARYYVLAVSLGLYQLAIPIDFSHRPSTGNLQEITSSDFEKVIQQAPI